MDPRIKTSIIDLQKQHDVSLKAYLIRKQILPVSDSIQRYRAAIKSALEKNASNAPDFLKEVDKQLASLDSTAPGVQEASFQRLNNALTSVFNILQDSEMPPSTQVLKTIEEAFSTADSLLRKWKELKNSQLPKLNEYLKNAGLTF